MLSVFIWISWKFGTFVSSRCSSFLRSACQDIWDSPEVFLLELSGAKMIPCLIIFSCLHTFLFSIIAACLTLAADSDEFQHSRAPNSYPVWSVSFVFTHHSTVLSLQKPCLWQLTLRILRFVSAKIVPCLISFFCIYISLCLSVIAVDLPLAANSADLNICESLPHGFLSPIRRRSEFSHGNHHTINLLASFVLELNRNWFYPPKLCVTYAFMIETVASVLALKVLISVVVWSKDVDQTPKY